MFKEKESRDMSRVQGGGRLFGSPTKQRLPVPQGSRGQCCLAQQQMKSWLGLMGQVGRLWEE